MIHSVIHVQRIHQIPFKHTLAFIATAVFLMSFFGSRLFATACPTCVVVGSGIHFHHFWYGIGMVALTDWLAIVGKRTGGLDRAYALVYGLGDACSNRELAPGVKPGLQSVTATLQLPDESMGEDDLSAKPSLPALRNTKGDLD